MAEGYYRIANDAMAEAIRQASVEELAAVPGMTRKAAQVLKDTL